MLQCKYEFVVIHRFDSVSVVNYSKVKMSILTFQYIVFSSMCSPANKLDFLFFPLLTKQSDVFYTALPFCSWSCPSSVCQPESLDNFIFPLLFLVSWIPLDKCMGPPTVWAPHDMSSSVEHLFSVLYNKVLHSLWCNG